MLTSYGTGEGEEAAQPSESEHTEVGGRARGQRGR